MSGLMKKKKKNATEGKVNKKPAPPPKEPEEEEALYDDGAEVIDDVYENPDKTPDEAPKVPGRLKEATPDDNIYEVTEDVDDESGASNGHADPPDPPPPRSGKKEKKQKQGAGHGFSLNTIQGALTNLNKKKKVQKQPSEEKHQQPLSPKSPKQEKETPEIDRNSVSSTSEPASPHRALPHLPPTPTDTPEKPDLPATPSPLPRVIHLTPPPVDDEEENPYTDALSVALSAYDWFHAQISREEGNKRVKHGGKDGTYLLRQSTKSDDQAQPYTLVLLYQNRVSNLKVRLRSDGQYALGEEKPNELAFKDVMSMITFHKKSPVKLTGHIQGETTLDEAASFMTS